MTIKKYIPSVIFISMFVGVQVTLKFDLRSSLLSVSLSDLLLPIICLYCFSTSLKQSDFRWLLSDRYLHFVFGLFFLWLMFSFFRTFQTMEHFSTWGFVNRLVGWLVVVAYFLVGKFIATKLSAENEISLFKILLILTCLVIMPGLINYFDFLLGGNTNNRLSNLGQNPNSLSFMISLLIIISSCNLFASSGSSHLPRLGKLDVCFTILFLALIFASSRTALVAFAIMMVGLLLLNRAVFYRLTFQFCGALILCLLILQLPEFLQPVFPGIKNNASSAQIILIEANDFVAVQSVEDPLAHRYGMFLRAISFWQENKLFGVGLGSWLILENQLGNHHTIHNTILWSLAELGLVGALLIASMFIYFVWFFSSNVLKKHQASQCIAGLSVIVFAFVFSQASDIFFQRILWLIMGFLIGVCRREAATSSRSRHTRTEQLTRLE